MLEVQWNDYNIDENNETMVSKYQQGYNQYGNYLIIKNIGLIRKIARYYANRYNVDFEELFDVSLYILCQVFAKFNLNRNIKFSTFIYVCLSNAIKRQAQLMFKDKQRLVPLDDVIQCYTINNNIDDIIFRCDLEAALKTLKPMEREVVELYLFKGYTLKEIGDKFNVTREYIRQVKDRALRKLRIKLTDYNLLKN